MGKFILTGGPCVGKTSVLEELAKKGFTTIPEAARAIIKQESENKTPNYKPILPWTDLQAFENLIVEKQLELEKMVNEDTFLDRSLVDPYAWAELGGVKLRDDMDDLVERADYTRVFILDRLETYTNDELRNETDEEAKLLHDKLYQLYDTFGFDIVEVPFFEGSKEEGIRKRVRFITNEMGSNPLLEIEKKYKVSHDKVKEKLKDYKIRSIGTDQENNRSYDSWGILRKNGLLFRLREIRDRNIITLKGKNRKKDMTVKPELNFQISNSIASLLRLIPEDLTYQKTREIYQPLGDANCQICFDSVPLLGEFVEIEAATENQVLLWEKRLGISGYAINKSYPSLVRENG
jgi:predicted adenylyl cyclase CyaB